MTELFISYSRKNKDFVSTLYERLQQAGRDLWIDWQGIPDSTQWWQQIQKGIEAANNFVFIMTPESLASSVCVLEVAHAIASGKRIIPVVHEDARIETAFGEIAAVRPDKILEDMLEGRDLLLVARENWRLLGHIDWLFFRETDNFEEAFTSLLKAIDTDPVHVEKHTRLLVLARHWQDGARPDDRLLVGEEIDAAEAWLLAAGGKDPEPTPLHREFIQQSRLVETRRRRLFRRLQLATVILGIVGIGAAVATVIAVITANNAEHDRDAANNAAATAHAEVIIAGQTLTPIPATLTPVGATLQAGSTLIADAQSDVEAARQTLTPLAQEIEEQTTRNQALQLSSAGIELLQQPASSAELAALLLVRSQNTFASPTTLGYLSRANQRLATRHVFDGQSGIVTSLANSGRFLATTNEDHLVRLWDVNTGELVYELDGHTDVVNEVDLSPDGRYAVTGSSDHTAVLWNLSDGTQAHLLVGHAGEVWGVDFSPDGESVLTGSEDGTVKRWEVETGAEIYTLDYGAAVWWVQLSPDGRYLFTLTEDNTVQVWEASTGSPIMYIESEAGFTDVDFSPDGKSLLLSSKDNYVNLVDIETAETVQEWILSNPPQAVAFSPDGRSVVAGDAEFLVTVWDVESGEKIHSLVGHTAAVNDVEFSPDGRYILSGGADAALLWDAETGELLQAFADHLSAVRLVLFSPDSQFAYTGSWDGTARMWTTSSPAQRYVFAEHSAKLNVIAISPDGSYALTGGDDSTAYLWELETGESQLEMSFDSTVTGAAFSPDSQWMLVGSADGIVSLWDVSSRQQLHRFELDNPMSYNTLAFSPDGKYIGASAFNEMLLWDTATFELVHRMDGHTNWISTIAFSPDSQYVLTGSKDTTAVLWNVETGQAQFVFRDSPQGLEIVAFSPDGRYAATGGLSTEAYLYDLSTGSLVQTLVGHTNTVLRIAFHPDGKHIVTGSYDGTARVWDMETGEEVSRAETEAAVWGMAISKDAQYLLVGAGDGEVSLWDVNTGAMLAGFMGHTDLVQHVAFSPDGRYALSGSNDATAIFWELSYDPMAYACANVFSDLTEDKRAAYGIEDDAPTCQASNSQSARYHHP